MDINKLTIADIEWLKACKWFMDLPPAKQDEFCDEMEQNGINPRAVAIFRRACKKAAHAGKNMNGFTNNYQHQPIAK